MLPPQTSPAINSSAVINELENPNGPGNSFQQYVKWLISKKNSIENDVKPHIIGAFIFFRWFFFGCCLPNRVISYI